MSAQPRLAEEILVALCIGDAVLGGILFAMGDLPASFGALFFAGQLCGAVFCGWPDRCGRNVGEPND